MKYSDEQRIEKIRETAEKLLRYLKETGITDMQLLPYHSYGASKYPTIGREYTFQSHTPSEEEMEHIRSVIAGYDVRVKI